MRYISSHPENLNVFLIVVGIVAYLFRSKISAWRTPYSTERMVEEANRAFIETVVKIGSGLLVVAGCLLTVAKFHFQQ